MTPELKEYMNTTVRSSIREWIGVYSDPFNANIRKRPILLIHRHLLHCIQRFKAIDDLAKYGVSVIEVRLRSVSNKELRAVGVNLLVRHTHNTSFVMPSKPMFRYVSIIL